MKSQVLALNKSMKYTSPGIRRVDKL